MSFLFKKLLLLHFLLRQCTEKFHWLPFLLTRLAIGLVFVESGWGKFHKLPSIIAYFGSLGIPAPELQAPFVAAVELICGLLILGGALTSVASLPLIGTMIVAIITAKKDDITSTSDLFFLSEYTFILLLLWLTFYGAGAFSIDNLIKRKMKK